LVHTVVPSGLRRQAMHSRLTKIVASLRDSDVAPLVSASALRDATNISAQNAVVQMTIRAKPDIGFSFMGSRARSP